MRFIVVDGLDGCGKDTHARRIAKALESRGEKVAVISHPSERRFGRISKKSLEGSGKVARLGATLFYIADVLMSVRWLKKQEGGAVIFVRYLMGAAYLPERLAPIGYKFFRNMIPFPDLAIYIDIDPKVARERILKRDSTLEMFESYEKLVEVRRIAKSLLTDEWRVVDNSVEGEAPFAETERLAIELTGKA